MLDETEFLADHGVRSLSKSHKDNPYAMDVNGNRYEVAYVPGDSDSGLFGGNRWARWPRSPNATNDISNWRGPIWLAVNFLLVESLLRHYMFYGKSLQVECPTGSGSVSTSSWMEQEMSCEGIMSFQGLTLLFRISICVPEKIHWLGDFLTGSICTWVTLLKRFNTASNIFSLAGTMVGEQLMMVMICLITIRTSKTILASTSSSMRIPDEAWVRVINVAGPDWSQRWFMIQGMPLLFPRPMSPHLLWHHLYRSVHLSYNFCSAPSHVSFPVSYR